MLLLMLSVVLMAGACFSRGEPRASLARRSTRRPRRRPPLLVLGLALTLVSMSTGAWAKQPGDTGAVMQGTTQSSTPTAPLSRGIQPAPAPDYASREASAKGLETFKGGDTVVVFGGSVLLIVLIVVLVVVLI